MQADRPLGYFITWTVYGTHLPGASSGWRRRGQGNQRPAMRLAEWYASRLTHPVLLLTRDHRRCVEQECRRHCEFRRWTLLAVSARSNHVHVVVAAARVSGNIVRDQLKARCTRILREHHAVFRDRPVWTVGGDWRCLNDDEDLHQACRYVIEAQDRGGTTR